MLDIIEIEISRFETSFDKISQLLILPVRSYTTFILIAFAIVRDDHVGPARLIVVNDGASPMAISTIEQNFSCLRIENGSFIFDDTRWSMDYVLRMLTIPSVGDLVGKVPQYSPVYVKL